MLTGWKFLSTTKITAIIKEMAGVLDSVKPLIFLNRTAVVNASDDDIMGKYTGKAFIADILANDQKALVYDGGKMTFATTDIPNLKFGRRLGQAMLNLLYRLEQMAANPIPSDVTQFTNWQLGTTEECLTAIRNRMNQLICAMELDSFVYNRFGMQITSGWGTPSNLKPTVATGWDTPATATPITDLTAITLQVGPDSYGKEFNRATMSTKAFRYMAATTEFRNLIAGQALYNFAAGQLPTFDQNRMRGYFEGISGLKLELYDGTYFDTAASGAETQVRVLPTTKVILTNEADDNQRNVRDFANGIVTETIVGSVTKKAGFTGPDYGPVAYFEDDGLNPPDITVWGVSRGFPRKHDEYSTAVLTVGSFS